MFDLTQLGLPRLVDAHGKKWVAVHRVAEDDEPISDERELFMAVDAAVAMPAPLQLISVPRSPAEVEMLKQARQRRKV